MAPYVEQIGWGVARQVARVLREAGVEDPAGILDRLPEVAETDGFLAYAVFEGRTATAAALVARARHDVANAGAEWLA